jgi:hypothetical protein
MEWKALKMLVSLESYVDRFRLAANFFEILKLSRSNMSKGKF